MKSIQLSAEAIYQIELALRTRIDEASANVTRFLGVAWGAELSKNWAIKKEEALEALLEFRGQL